MSSGTRRWIKILLFIFGVVLTLVKATDADLIDIESIQDNFIRATTLDFSNRYTANNLPNSVLFNVTGMIPSGFEVKSLRIWRDGELDMYVNVVPEKTGGDDDFCNILDLMVLQNWKIKYQGSLMGFSYQSSIFGKDYDDYVFVVSLNDEDPNFSNKSCQFNFVLQTVASDGSELEGFTDREILQNRIDSGTWN